MRIDVDQIFAQVARERAEREVDAPMLRDTVREDRLIAALVREPELLDTVPELEVGDFAGLQAGFIFRLLRNLEHKLGGLSYDDVLEALLANEDGGELELWCYAYQRVVLYPPFVGARCLRECVERLQALRRIRSALP